MAATNEKHIIAGGCQCGSVRYEVEVVNYDAYYCHCRMCQLAFGNIFATFINFEKAKLKWLKSTPDHFASSKLALRGFCAKCGTPLSFEYADSDRMDIALGSIDDPTVFKPTSHYGTESRVENFAHEDLLPCKRFDENKEFIEKWQTAYGKDSMPGPLSH